MNNTRSFRESGVARTVFVLIMFVCASCQNRHNVTTWEDLKDLDRKAPLLVCTVEGTLYRFTTYTVEDSLLTGSGERRDGNTWTKDSMRLPWSQIAYIQGRSSRFLGSLVEFGFVGVFVGLAGVEMQKPDGLTVNETIGRPSGSSCPFVYSWNGDRFVLEGEAFGTAIGRKLESSTAIPLRSIKTSGGKATLQITNERPETHYINAVRLFAIESGENLEVALADDGTAWPVARRQKPIAAVDEKGNDAMDLVGVGDGRFWDPTGDNEEITCAFVNPGRDREMSLLLTCMNTPVAEGMVRFLSDFLGDSYLDFVYALEHDPGMPDLMRQWYEKNAICLAVRTESGWKEMGRFIQQGNAAPFERLMRLALPERTGDTVWVRLRMRPDLWRVDAVAADLGSASPLPRIPLAMRRASHGNGEDVRPALAEADGRYVMVLPPDHLDLEFDAARSSTGKRVTYAIDVRGYMYEWYIEGKPTIYATLGKIVPDKWKMGLVKYFMRRPGSHLPAAYRRSDG